MYFHFKDTKREKSKEQRTMSDSNRQPGVSQEYVGLNFKLSTCCATYLSGCNRTRYTIAPMVPFPCECELYLDIHCDGLLGRTTGRNSKGKDWGLCPMTVNMRTEFFICEPYSTFSLVSYPLDSRRWVSIIIHETWVTQEPSLHYLCPHGTLSCRLSIPQKLSKSTLSLPCNHRTMTFAPPSCPSSLILKPSAASPSSSSFMAWSMSVELVEFCCCFRLAARDQTFPLAKPTPIAMIGRYSHCNSSTRSVSFR